MLSSHSCCIYGKWRSIKVKGRFKVIIWGGGGRGRASEEGMGLFFIWGGGRVDPSRHHVNILLLQLEE